MQIRRAQSVDQPFLIEMARLACAVEGRHPIPAAEAAEVIEMLPGTDDLALVATDGRQRSLGAVWCHQQDPPLLRDQDGRALPELAIAVNPDARGHGLGAELIDALAQAVSGHAAALVLNVHLLNPAVRLYVRTGFRVAGRGRGWYGVAMRRPLGVD